MDERWQPLLAGNPAIERTVVFPRQSFRGPAGALRSIPWMLGLGKNRPDVALDLQGLLRSALMARFSGADRTVGLADAREGARWFYKDVSAVRPGEHSVLRYLRTLETLGLPKVETPEFFLPPGIRPAHVLPKTPFVLLHPFARGSGKSLSQKHVSELCRALHPLPVVLAGMGELRKAAPENTVNLLNLTSLDELIWLIRAAAFVVSVDSGPMHIAAAVNPRLLAIHTWSDPRLVGPYGEEAWIWQGGEIRRQNLSAGTMPAPRLPTDEDIARIAERVRKEM
ncbi:MAG: glycosyltransferase family 9 protein [Terrimicrobiaceae bacterium]